MSAVASELVHLEILPAEILLAVVQYLHVNEVKQLYGTSKRLREVCRPSLFAHVGFEFAQDEAQKLERLLVSSICKHVVLFTCRVKKRLRPGMYVYTLVEFTLTYAMEPLVNDLYKPPECLAALWSFRKAYKELCDMFEKQNDTENIGPLLSNVFCALPCLKGVRLVFCETPDLGDWFSEAEITISNDFYKHDLSIVKGAMQNAAKDKIDIDTVQLCNLNLPKQYLSENQDLTGLSEILRELLQNTKTLQLRDARFALLSLCGYKLGLRQLDMCQVGVTSNVLKSFFESNRATLQSIGFHEETVLWEDSISLTASVLREIIDVSPSTACRAYYCDCHTACRKASRLVLDKIALAA